MLAKQLTCRTCRQKKDRDLFPGKHSKQCLACAATRLERRRLKEGPARQCLACLETKPPDAFAYRCRTCLDCRVAPTIYPGTFVHDGILARRCSKCQVVVPFDKYYINGRNPNGTIKQRSYACPECFKARVAEQTARRDQTPEGREQRRIWSRRSNQRRRERIQANEGLRLRELETSRISRRLRREREDGVSVSDQVTLTVELPPDIGGCLSVAPLVAMMRHVAYGRQMSTEEVCALGDVDSRVFRRWRSGEHDTVQFDVADRVLTGLGLHWWDVWEGDEHARQLFEQTAAA